MPRVLLAPDKFKGTLTAASVAHHLEIGLRLVDPDLEIRVIPVADGGDGTLAAAEAAGFERVPVVVTGPTGEPTLAAWGRRGAEAVVELAEASGLGQLPPGRMEPMSATSRGTGELIAAALDAGAHRIVVGVGGSACSDGGAGLLQALGLSITDELGNEVPPGGAGLISAATVDMSRLHRGLAEADIVVACDVDNQLTGPSGAAAVYGPQKGASPSEVDLLDCALAHWADLLAAATGQDRRRDPGAGAAGGVAFGLIAAAGARIRPGADVVFSLTELSRAVQQADVVITGEGSLDIQTLRGKAPAAVSRIAAEAGVPVIAVAGRVALGQADLEKAGFRMTYALVDEAAEDREAFQAPGPILERLGARIARECLGCNPLDGI